MISQPLKFGLFGSMACCCSLLTGCSAYPIYQTMPNEKTVSVRVIGSGKLAICKNTGYFSLPVAENSGIANVPAGERVTMETPLVWVGYNITYSCAPALSFLPKEGEKYVLHSYVRNQQCFIEIARENSATLTGVDFEPTAGTRGCTKKK